MKRYIAEGGWVSCSQDSVGSPKQLERRRSATVLNENGKYYLTKIDTALTKKFICNAPIKFYGGLGSLGIGFLLGVAAAGIAIPGIGWAIAAIALLAIAAAVIAAALVNDCNSELEGTEWVDFHEGVSFDGGENAILYFESTLICPKGGTLIASKTYDQANKLSNSMSVAIWGENISHFGSQLAIGYLAGKFGGTSPLGIAVNATLTEGLYRLGETVLSDTPECSMLLGTLKISIPDTLTTRLEIIGIQPELFLTNLRKGIAAGFAGMAIDGLSNYFESELGEVRNELIEDHKERYR